MADAKPQSRHFLIRYAGLWLLPLSLLVALLLAEGVLRQFPRLMPEEAQLRLLWQQQATATSIGDSYLGYVYPAYLKTEIGAGSTRFSVVSDEHGFRNASPWPERARIVVVGDSLTYGWGLTAEESWTALLEKQLGNDRVITLGLPGTVPQQYTRYLEKYGLGLRPEIVIYGIFSGNDFHDSINFEHWLAQGAPGNYAVWKYFDGDVPRRSAGWLERSYLSIFVRYMRKNFRDLYSSTTLKFSDGEKMQLAPSILTPAIRESRPGSEGLRHVMRATLEARDLAQAAGSQFVVLLFPTKEEIYLPLQGTDFPSLFAPLKSALQEAGIPYIDLPGRYAELAADNRTLYFEVDTHPHAYGNQVTADVVVEFLARNPPAAMPP
ncbi:MAG TPA: GDSL-type esterase/lipase family protein [Steroidobacteraceae bacterium]|nr:GDSL-type esterase/lipase family protein [Steroidobacteraceae bacterium]